MFEFAPAALTVCCAWYAMAAAGAEAGKGWFMRNWIAATTAFLFGIIVFAAMLAGGLWMLAAALIAAFSFMGAVGVHVKPAKKDSL